MRLRTRRELLAALAAAAAAASVVSKAARAQEKLRAGVLRLASSGPVFIAFERGYFRGFHFGERVRRQCGRSRASRPGVDRGRGPVGAKLLGELLRKVLDDRRRI